MVRKSKTYNCQEFEIIEGGVQGKRKHVRKWKKQHEDRREHNGQMGKQDPEQDVVQE